MVEDDVRFEPAGPNCYRVTGRPGTRVDPLLFVDDVLLETIRDSDDLSVKQLLDAASLPGVVFVGGMPDIHQGYGVPVGCVMGMDAEDGLVSAGAVGMDINCGVRLLASNIPVPELSRADMKRLGRTVLKRIPVGIGTTGPHKGALEPHLEDILVRGVEALVDLGYAHEDDLPYIQDRGRYPNARLDPIPDRARERLGQLSTLGGGNHFLELVEVDRIHDPEAAEVFGLRENTLGFLIHTGSRGFGHQICVDYSDRMMDRAGDFGLSFPTAELASAPIGSDPGRDYLGAMACAANLAYANRQMMTYDIRDVFDSFFSGRSVPPRLSIVYDITHNLARFETIGDRDLLMHRKGAVRALPGDHPDTPEVYRGAGHPVIVPGNMGVGSYVLRAGEEVERTGYSVNHGAGRRMSRTAAKEQISEGMMQEALGEVQLLGAARSSIRDEAPQAYKNVHEVVDVLVDAGIAEAVAHLQPLVVIKGD